jgi:hypothetical protein
LGLTAGPSFAWDGRGALAGGPGRGHPPHPAARRRRWKLRSERSCAQDRSAPVKRDPRARAGADLRGTPAFPRFQRVALSTRVSTNPRGNKDGIPGAGGCALSLKPAGLRAKLGGCWVRGLAKEGRPHSLPVGQPERPWGAAPASSPSPGPGQPSSSLLSAGGWIRPPRTALCVWLRPMGAYLGHRPASGRRQAPAGVHTPPPPPRSPSPASPFLPREVGARRTQYRQRLRSRSLLAAVTSARS